MSENKISGELSPVILIRIGSDDIATVADLDNVIKYVQEHNSPPKDGEIIGQSGFPIPINISKVNRSPTPGMLLVKVGNETRPASADDIKKIQQELCDFLKDNNEATIVTYHNMEMKWLPIDGTSFKESLPQTLFVSGHLTPDDKEWANKMLADPAVES